MPFPPPHMRTQGEGGHLQSEESFLQEPNQPAPWLWTSSLPNCEKKFCCSSHRFVVLFHGSLSRVSRSTVHIMNLQQHMPEYIFSNLLFLLFVLGEGHVFAYTTTDKFKSLYFKIVLFTPGKTSVGTFFSINRRSILFLLTNESFNCNNKCNLILCVLHILF